MNEAQTRLNLIDPAIRAAGWTEENDCQVLVEQTVAPGRVGKVRGKPLRADYILCHRRRRLMVVEAKGDEHQAIEGYEQALKYGRMLGVQVAYATNGREILEIDLATGGANPVAEFPAPQELWSFMGLGGGEGWVEAFSLVPLWFDAVKRPRYHQELAVNRVTDAIAARQRRILLTLATGTGQDVHRVPDRVEALQGKVESPGGGGRRTSGRADAAHPLHHRPQHPRQPGADRLQRIRRTRACARHAQGDPQARRQGARERDEERVRELLDKISPMDKTIIFCYNQPHAMEIMSMVNKFQKLAEKTPDYCRRVTANDGEEGERFLREFQNNEKQFPVVLTTSQKLSTGVDARNVRNIVLMRPVNSMVEFKQIVGRGTRLFDEKYYFTIYDFVGASDKFNDPAWDGPPVCPKCGCDPCVCVRGGKGGRGGGEGGDGPKACPICGNLPCTCEKTEKTIVIRLGKDRKVQVNTEWESLIMYDVKMIPVEAFVKKVFAKVTGLVGSTEELRRTWSEQATRRELLAKLAENGFEMDRLKELQKLMDSEDCDLLDVLEYVAFEVPMQKRAARAGTAAKGLSQWVKDEQAKGFYTFVLDNYVQVGVDVFTRDDALSQLIVTKYHTLPDASRILGDLKLISAGFATLQRAVYAA